MDVLICTLTCTFMLFETSLCVCVQCQFDVFGCGCEAIECWRCENCQFISALFPPLLFCVIGLSLYRQLLSARSSFAGYDVSATVA